MTTIWLVIAILLIVGTYSVYVGLVKKKNNVSEAAAGIDVQLKKRYDLVPNLLKTAKKFMEHEKELFTKVTELREAAISAANYEAKFKADAQLCAGLRAFNARAENYPELKSDEMMTSVQAAMAETEEHIAAARRFYNSAVKDYKNSLEIFPSSLIAALMGLKDEYPFFEAEAVAKEPIDANQYL